MNFADTVKCWKKQNKTEKCFSVQCTLGLTYFCRLSKIWYWFTALVTPTHYVACLGSFYCSFTSTHWRQDSMNTTWCVVLQQKVLLLNYTNTAGRVPLRVLWGYTAAILHARYSCHSSCSIFSGGTDLERRYGDVRPWRPPFQASPVVRKGPISSERVSSQDPILRKFGNFSLYSLTFHPNFSSQLGNFQLTSPQIWKFSVHKLPFSEANVNSQALHFENVGRTPLPEKKLECPSLRVFSQYPQ